MPHTKQNKKRVKTNEGRRQRNISRLTLVRHAVRDLRAAIVASQGKRTKELETQWTGVCVLLDRMAGKGLLHRNQTARLKSRLTSQMPS